MRVLERFMIIWRGSDLFYSPQQKPQKVDLKEKW